MELITNTDLTNCDREPIHIPGHIQPHGFLLALDPGSLAIEKVSANTELFSGKNAAALLGQPLGILHDVIMPSRAGSSLTDLVTLGRITGNFEQLNPQEVIVNGAQMFLICHQHRDHIICEFEPYQSSNDNITLQKMMSTALSVIQSSVSFDELLNHVAKMVKEITGYSRIMIYKFHKDQHGEVVAEAKEAELESWLHLHYPASDIPVQARELYKLNLVRIIADVYSQPSALLSYEGNTLPLDLTHSVLRAVSPIHIEYLKNMEVGASFSISLVSKGELWGLIACHNSTDRFIDYNSRVACRFIGQLFSAALEFKSDERAEERNTLLLHKQQKLFDQL
ncbi:MAG: GAF domain-containing protein, partial [Chitinophagaceae bacterium]